MEDFVAKITHPPKGEKITSVGNTTETQSGKINFTAQGKNVYLETHPNTEIDTTVQPTYIDNKTGQVVTLTTDGTYTVEGQGTYKFTTTTTGATVTVEFTPVAGFVGKADGISIRRQDTNKTTTDWGVYNPTNDPSITNINDVLNSMDGLYIPEVVVSTSVNNAESKNLQGLTQKGQPTFNVETATNPVTASMEHPAKLVDPKTGTVTTDTTVDAFENGTTNKIGIYTIVPETGEVTFTPNKDFTGIPAPATISVEVELGRDKAGVVTKKTLTGTYTPTIIQVTPTGTPVNIKGIQGTTQEGIPTFTPGKGNIGTEENPVEKSVPMDPTAYKLLGGENGTTPLDEVPAMSEDGKKQVGTYTISVVEGKPVVTFTPTDKTYAGKLKSVTVQGKDTNGTKATTTYTLTVIGVTPTGTNASSEGIQGSPQEGTVTFTPGKGNIGTEENPVEKSVPMDPTAYKLLGGENGTTPLDEVPAMSEDGKKQVGTYTISVVEGKPVVTFTPTDKTYAGKLKPVTVQGKDRNGTPTTATYTPVVKAAVPTVEIPKTTDVQGAVQTVTPVFTPGKNTVNNVKTEVPFEPTSKAKLIDPSKTGDEAEVTSLEVPNQGTYTIDDNGDVTFTPLPTFKGEATAVSIVRKDKNGTLATATYTPSVVGVTPAGTNASSEGIQGSSQEVTVTFTPGKGNIGTKENPVEKTIPMNPDAYKLLGGENGTTPLDEVPAMSEDGKKQVGTYTISVVEGKPVVTFTPTDKTYTGKLKPVTVQGKDTNGTEATATYTPTVRPVPTENGKENKPSKKEIIRDIDGNPIPGFEYAVMSPTLDIPEYVYVETVIDPDGTVRHIYRPVETVHKDKDGNSIPNVASKEKGKKESKAIPGYRLVATKKLPNGDIEHIYEKVQATTTWVDELGNVIQPTEEGLLNPSEIPGYEFVRTETDANGNVRHVYRKVQSTISVESVQTVEVKETEAKRELPNTGTEDHANLVALGLLGALSGFGLLARKKKED